MRYGIDRVAAQPWHVANREIIRGAAARTLLTDISNALAWLRRHRCGSKSANLASAFRDGLRLRPATLGRADDGAKPRRRLCRQLVDVLAARGSRHVPRTGVPEHGSKTLTALRP